MNKSNSKDNIINKPFKARARLLPQLGDMLIKSEDVAFLELIKNSYDADAENVRVVMDNMMIPEKGIIIIEDDGDGMNKDLILNVWLELASNFKTEKVKRSEKTPKGRLPIGEKGIGRLGVHKLGNKIELISKKENEKEVQVNIDWRDFEKSDYLEDVPVTISDFRDKTNWTRGKFREIQRTITSFTNPFDEANDNFKPTIEILDHPEWLDDIITWDEVKDYSIISFEIMIENDEIKTLNYQYSPNPIFEKAKNRNISFDVSKPINELSDDEKLVHANKSTLEKKKNAKEIDVSKLGTIKFKGYIFNLEAFVIKDTVSDKKGLRTYLRENSGIKVYRGTEPKENNKAGYVRVYNYGEPGNDWLGLNLKRVNFPSSISNNLIIGGVFLDRESSKVLKEKTDRQGFIEDDNYRNFENAINHSISVIDIFRKSDVKALRDLYGPKGGEEPVISSINKLRGLVDEKIKGNKVLNKAINKYIDDIEKSYNTIQSQLIKTANAGLGLGIVLHEIEKIIAELISIVKNKEEPDNVSTLIKRLSRLVKGYAEIFKKSSRTDIILKNVIDDAIFSIEFRLKAHNISVEKKYKNSNLTVKLAKGLVEGVIINILDNSVYWLEIAKSEHKSIPEKKIFINIEETEKSIHLIIADNGPGFLLSKTEIIQPFVTGKKSGMGLGLHIANEIMLSHKGKLSFPDFGDYDIPEEYKKGAVLALIFPK